MPTQLVDVITVADFDIINIIIGNSLVEILTQKIVQDIMVEILKLKFGQDFDTEL